MRGVVTLKEYYNFYPRPPGGGRPATGLPVLLPTNFYPRPPGGGRPFTATCGKPLKKISIHALRVEGDAGATFHDVKAGISIHALRVEGDQASVCR